MDRRKKAAKALPLVLAGIFIIIALSAFIAGYKNLDSVDLPVYNKIPEENSLFFYLNFYIPFFLFVLLLTASLLSRPEFLKYIFSILSLVFAILSCYILSDLFTIKFNIYAAQVIIIASIFSLQKSIMLNSIYIILFVVFLFHPSFLGTGTGSFTFNSVPSFLETLIFAVLLAGLASITACCNFLFNENLVSEDTVEHLNSIITQLTVFNLRLQEYAKTSSEEAIKTDRLRFTSDLHNKCGYVFTIIITLTEAAISFGEHIPEKVETTLQKIRKQAREGLQQTRETLYMIRDIQEPWTRSIDTIYQMKSIFEDVTGIKVDIEVGNIRFSYGKTINKALARILQEAFTNSVRHGKATHILIHFWEFPDTLTMTVTDNGIGAKIIIKRIGLAGMEERLAEIGGNMEVSSPEEGGFRIRVKIPINTVSDDQNTEELANGGPGTAHTSGG